MEILENQAAWLEHFEANWLKHLRSTGETDFKNLYDYVTNQTQPSGSGIDVRTSKIGLISTAGSYDPMLHVPFDAANLEGDPSIRTWKISDIVLDPDNLEERQLDYTTTLDDLAFAHDHYTHEFVDQDPQVAIPIKHLKDLDASGEIGELADTVISLHGYIPNAVNVVQEAIPQVIEIVKAEQWQGAIFAPM